MIRHRRSPFVLVALMALLAAPAIATTAPAAPNLPAIPLPPGSEKARFKVVVEGTATAAKDFDGGGVSACLVTVTGHVDERTTYRRGRGVVMEFVRLGDAPRAPILVQRGGRLGDSSLALKVTTTRTARGSTSRVPAPGVDAAACPPLSEDLATGAQCGKPQVSDASAGFLYNRAAGLLRLRLNASSLIGVDTPLCPESQVAAGLDSLTFGWPAPPAINDIRFFFPPKVIFGVKRVLVGTVTVSPPRRKGPVTVSLGSSVSWTETNFGTNTLTIRMIRLP